jgi:chemotaxis response regulator CheB
MKRSINNAIISRTLENEESYVVVVNFRNEEEVVNVKEKLNEVPDVITMRILSINSDHMEG